MRRRGPFWLPASNYYLLAGGLSLALFFLVWGILNDGRDSGQEAAALLIAGIFFVTAIFVREVVLRNARSRFLREQRRLDRSVLAFASHAVNPGDAPQRREKVTAEQNSAILREIKKKSEAASVLGTFPEGHREVFLMCGEYLSMSSREMQNAGVGSPRIKGFVRGREIASKLHRYHLLRWAEIESLNFTQHMSSRAKISDKLAGAKKALEAVDFAITSYPNEPTLTESRSVLVASIDSLTLNRFVERAEKAETKGNRKVALRNYGAALSYLEKIGTERPDTSSIAERITEEVKRIESTGKDK